MFQRPDRPDFERFLTTIRGRCADRVPVAESLIDNRIKAAVLGKPILTLADDVAFWEHAGYDHVCLPSGILDPGQPISAERKLGAGNDSYSKDDADARRAAESRGQIACLAD